MLFVTATERFVQVLYSEYLPFLFPPYSFSFLNYNKKR